MDAPPRFLSFERCYNFRDLGGYGGLDGRTVRWRRLFRSMTPQYMSLADTAAAARLGIGLVVDFRGERFPSSGALAGEGVMRISLSPSSVQRSEAEYERYRAMPPEEALPQLLDSYGPQYAIALDTIAQDPSRNALFHCRLGKDRTGVFAALVLKLLGVADQDVAQDYLLTEHHHPHMRRLIEEAERDDPVPVSLVAQEPATLAAIEAVLARLEAGFGGAYGYFDRLKVPSATLDRFIESALEPRVE